MPLFGAFITSLAAAFYTFVASLVGAAWAVRITAAVTLGGIYLSCVVFYTAMIGPWLATVFTTAYGALLGLLFPPIAGSIAAGMALYYTCVTAKRYTAKLMKMAVG